jgi:Leucine-rich repeat (LRR) protein
MSNNNLEDLDGIETLGNGTSEQKTFHFDKNQIRSIPPQIRHINNLYWLNLNHNQLDNLPTDIFEVTTLSHLYIQDNRFRPDQKELIKKEFKDKNPELDLHL